MSIEASIRFSIISRRVTGFRLGRMNRGRNITKNSSVPGPSRSPSTVCSSRAGSVLSGVDVVSVVESRSRAPNVSYSRHNILVQ